MSSKKEMMKCGKLSREILGLFGATAAISIFFYGFLSITADSIVQSYLYRNDIIFTETQTLTTESWIQSICFGAAVFLFVVLFLFLVGQKLAYLNEIVRGVESLRMHRMDFEMPVEGNNELTELAESINYLSQTERELKEKENQIREEREALIRALSHDIRTPLTTILSYSEYMRGKGKLEDEEMEAYISLMQQKAEQIKGLTDRLLDSRKRNLEKIEDGQLLMQQLVEEWEMGLEEQFDCYIDLNDCPRFSCAVDIQEMRRIFDNLSSNIKKYAESSDKVKLHIYIEKNRLVIEQKNKKKIRSENVDSYKIGIESIRSIAENHNGDVVVTQSDSAFCIRINLFEINSL